MSLSDLLFIAMSLAVLLAWTVLLGLALRNLGRRCAAVAARSRWVVIGGAALHATALMPVLAVLGLAALVARSRLATGAWPYVPEPRLDLCYLEAPAGFHSSAFPLHLAIVRWVWFAALVSPLLCVPIQTFLVGLGRTVHWRLLGWHAALWLAWMCLAYADPGGFASWAGCR